MAHSLSHISSDAPCSLWRTGGLCCSLSAFFSSCPPRLVGSSPSRFSLLIIKEEFAARRRLHPLTGLIKLSPLAETVWSGTVDWPHKLFDLSQRKNKLATWLWRAARDALNICYFSLILFSGWVQLIFTLFFFPHLMFELRFLQTFSLLSVWLCGQTAAHLNICAAQGLMMIKKKMVSRPVVLIMLLCLWEESSINRRGTARSWNALIFCMAEHQCKVAEREGKKSTSDWVGFSLLTRIFLSPPPPSMSLRSHHFIELTHVYTNQLLQTGRCDFWCCCFRWKTEQNVL